MFDDFNGLPLHPLVVHAAVVLVPLASLLGLLYVVPRTRTWARLPFLLVTLASVPTVFVARASGSELKGALNLGGEALDLVNEHEDRATLLFVLVIGYAVVAVLAYVADRSRGVSKAMSQLVAVLVVVGALAVAYQTYRVGDIGSRAVWDFVEFDQSS